MERVSIEQLIDAETLEELGRGKPAPSPHRLREVLPRGWVLDQDPRYARRDLRVLARDGWVLVLGLVSFGTVGLGMMYNTFPRGLRGIGFFIALVVVVLIAGGLVGPMITRSLTQRGPKDS